MYLAAAPPTQRVYTSNVAKHYGISVHHLQKAVLGLARLGYVTTLPGRNGGLRLARPAEDIRLGALVAASEETGHLVDCHRGPCPLVGRCLLKCLLDQAERVFIQELDKMTLADVVAKSTGVALLQMMSLPPPVTLNSLPMAAP